VVVEARRSSSLTDDQWRLVDEVRLGRKVDFQLVEDVQAQIALERAVKQGELDPDDAGLNVDDPQRDWLRSLAGLPTSAERDPMSDPVLGRWARYRAEMRRECALARIARLRAALPRTRVPARCQARMGRQPRFRPRRRPKAARAGPSDGPDGEPAGQRAGGRRRQRLNLARGSGGRPR
jgi:hypothetical protein